MDIHDLVYDTEHNLKLDIFYPIGEGKKPAIVFIHGGGWVGGDKASGEEEFWKSFTKDGFIVVSLNYRLFPEAIYPENIKDVIKALEFLKENSEELRIDTDRVVFSGHSAGAYLALMGAFREDLKKKDSIRPKAVVSFYGPLDFYDSKDRFRRSLIDRIRYKSALELSELYLGKSLKNASDEFLQAASPISYLKKDSLPILIQQGKKDHLIPNIQINSLRAKLLETGNTNTEIELFDRAGHGSQEFFTADNRRKVLEFIRKNIP